MGDAANIIKFPSAEPRLNIALTHALYVHKELREDLMNALIKQDRASQRRAAIAAEELLFLILPGEDVELRNLLLGRHLTRMNNHG